MSNKLFILFVSNLDKNVKEADLHKLFNEYPISYIKIAKDHQTKESFGYAFIGMKHNSAKAEEAINRFNYQKMPGFKKTIKVCWYNMDRSASKHREDLNVFVKKIPKEVTHKEFHDYYSKFGNINSLKIAEDEEGESMGYGFVLFEKPEEAEKAIKETHGKEFKGKQLWVGKFIKNKPKKPVEFNNLYVKNIPKEYSEEEIKKMFSKFGELGSCLIKEPKKEVDEKMPEEKKNQILNHKFAFICFKKAESAKNALNEIPFFKLNDKDYNKKLKEVSEKFFNLKKFSDKVSQEHKYRFPVFLIENYKLEEIFNEKNEYSELENAVGKFNEVLKEYDGTYIVKDKSDRIECCQALNKLERERKAKKLYEKIKKLIKEKYKFCNLYVKNLPDDFDDNKLRELFEQYGSIKSCKTIKKDLTSSYLGIKRSVKVFGYVCFNDKESAHLAKKALEGKIVGNNKLYVDYHQSKAERNEFLKLNMINKSQKNKHGRMNDLMNPMIPNIRHMPQSKLI